VGRTLALIFLGLLVHPGSLKAQGEPGEPATPSLTFGEIWIEEEGLHFAVTAEGFFNEEVRRTIEQGGTTALDFSVELYRKRRNWFDARVRTLDVLPFRISYDSFARQYLVLSTDIRLRTDEYDQAVDQCTRLADVFVGTLSDLRLDPEDTYYLIARVRFQPMAVETVDEIRNWVGGSQDRSRRRETGQEGGGVGSRLARVLVSAAGFGETELEAESPHFRPADLPER